MDATAIRAELDHPVVDADGHIIEYVPALRDLIGDDAGGAPGNGRAARSDTDRLRRCLVSFILTPRIHTAAAARPGGARKRPHRVWLSYRHPWPMCVGMP